MQLSSSTSAHREWRSRGRRTGRPDRIASKIYTTLNRVFGLKQLRPGQEEVIRHVLSGHDTLALMATGAGKSLCYQLPAAVLPGRTLVITPLISLMKDQCDKLRALGLPAVQLNSGQLAIEREKAEEAVETGDARIIMTTPEQLSHPDFLTMLGQHPISLMVIDEAHCIPEWGHDFRPAYLAIDAARERLGRPPVLALTATATQEAITEVMQHLNLPDMQVVNTGIFRSNLRYAVDHVSSEDSKNARLLTLLDSYKGQGVVYTSTVKSAQEVYEMLTSSGESVAVYHGRLSAGERRAAQDAYMHGQARVMVATSAFGLGIDKADTRFVIHYQMPGNLETYYQESGRAGRDGMEAQCTLIYLARDKAIQQFFLTGRYPSVDDLHRVYSELASPPPREEPHWTVPLLVEALGRARTKIQVLVTMLRKQKLLRVDAQGHITLARAGLDRQAIEAVLESYADRKQMDRGALEDMVFYCQSGYCRWKMLLQHFDQDADFDRCGHCDNCVRMAQAERSARREAMEVLEEVRAQPALSFREGDLVRVPRYGLGIVSGTDDLGVTVRFPTGPQRSFLPMYVSAA